ASAAIRNVWFQHQRYRSARSAFNPARAHFRRDSRFRRRTCSQSPAYSKRGSSAYGLVSLGNRRDSRGSFHSFPEVGMHGVCCGLGDMGTTPFNWSTLGDDDTTDISTIDTASLGLPGGILDPSSPTVTVGQLSDFINTGRGDPSFLDQMAALVKSIG